jgi:hypothetical protein
MINYPGGAGQMTIPQISVETVFGADDEIRN